MGPQGSSSYIPPINNSKNAGQNDDVNSQHSHLVQQQSKRLLNISENSNNAALGHAGAIGQGTSSGQSSGPQTQVRGGRHLFSQGGSTNSQGGGVHQMQVNSKSNSNLGVNMQGLPYQDNIVVAVGGSQGGGSFTNAHGHGHHGFMMNKVPSKLSGIQLNQSQSTNATGATSGAAAVALPAQIQMQGSKRSIIPAQPGFQNTTTSSQNGSQGGGHALFNAHQIHQQQVLQQMHKQSQHHFMGQSSGPGSNHGRGTVSQNQYGGSNEFLLESQKIIYAPPSREKSKQTVRSPMAFEGAKATSVNGGSGPAAQGNRDDSNY